MAVLDVEGLTMSYADKKLYEDASFQLEKHEHMGIVGQNGAGKSTLIKILIGKVLPVDGSVKWQKGVKIGYLDQYVDIPAGMTLIQFLHTAFQELYQLNDQMNKYYAAYADKMDDSLLTKAGRIQVRLARGGRRSGVRDFSCRLCLYTPRRRHRVPENLSCQYADA